MASLPVITDPGPETVRRLPHSATSLADAEDGKKAGGAAVRRWGGTGWKSPR